MIRNFKPRLYQEAILGSVVKYNTLVVLPTGLGKTNIFLLAAAQRIKQYPKSKILLIGPTRPLIDQYYEVFKEHFEISEDKMSVLTGHVKPEKRVELWKSATIIFSTPQGLENDILSSKLSFEDVSLIGFDEAHRATGEYTYVWLAKKYCMQARFKRIIAMTASPGSDVEKISEVCKNLMIEEIEVRTEADPDVKPYIQEIKIDYVKIDLPEEFLEIKKNLQLCIKTKLEAIKKYGYLNTVSHNNKGDLLKLQRQLQMKLGQGFRDFTVLKSISLLAEALKAGHALELLETQGVYPLIKYFERLKTEGVNTKVKALKNLLEDVNFKIAIIKTEKINEKGIEHPKIYELKKMLKEYIDKGVKKTIIFNQYRDSAIMIKNELSKLTDVEARIFVGQAKKEGSGLSQKEQKKILDDFREGKFNVLIATSIGEEGLDIVKVDLVVFYEPIPSAIRSIQRRGRTGRHEKGRVVTLVTRDTRDEAYRWVAHHKEKRMHRILKSLKSNIKLNKKEEIKLTDYTQSGLKIFADTREKGLIAKELSDQGVNIELTTLGIGDYILSSRVGVEVKLVEDFVNSIIDGRLLRQLKALKTSFEKPVVIIEGREDIYSVRGVHPNAIRGMLATIAIDYSIPVMMTRDHKETAALLCAIALREQGKGEDDIQLHNAKPLSLKQQQEYLVSSLPGVESTIAKALLREFKNIKSIVTADEKTLKKAEYIGEKKAREIKRVVDSDYE